MKWSLGKSKAISKTLLASLVLAAIVAVGPLSKALAKGKSSQELALDDIELDLEKPHKARKKVSRKPASKPSQRETEGKAKVDDVNDVELDGEEKLDVAAEEAPLPAPVAAAIKKAQGFEDKKQFAQVVATLKPFVDRLSRSGTLLMARAYAAQADTFAELHMLQLIVAKNPADYVVQTQVGEALVKLKRNDEAVEAFQAARQTNKLYKPPYEALYALFEKEDRYEARSLLLDMVKVFGPTPKTSTALCRSYSTDDFLAKATELCRAAVEADPKNPENYVHLGLSLRDQEKPEEAVKVLSDAAKRFPASEWTQATAGELKASKKDFADSYRHFKQGTVADPKSVRSWVGLAQSAHELQKYDEAMASFKTACGLDRRTALQFRSAASTLRKSGNMKWYEKYQNSAFECE